MLLNNTVKLGYNLLSSQFEQQRSGPGNPSYCHPEIRGLSCRVLSPSPTGNDEQ